MDIKVPPPIMWIIERNVVIIFWAHNPISFEHMSIWYLLMEPHQTTSHSNIGDKDM